MSVEESIPTSVAAKVLPSLPTKLTAAGVRRKTCAAVTTRPVRQTTAEASAPWWRPGTASVLAPTCSTMAARTLEWACSGLTAASWVGLFMERVLSDAMPESTRLRPLANPPTGQLS